MILAPRCEAQEWTQPLKPVRGMAGLGIRCQQVGPALRYEPLNSGTAGPGRAWPGAARPGEARQGPARQGVAWLGLARHGEARQG